MKALVLTGRLKGKEIKIGQWCNDWFLADTGNAEIDRKPFSPKTLAFKIDDIHTIQKHKNNGTLFEEYEITQVMQRDEYEYSFRRKRI